MKALIILAHPSISESRSNRRLVEEVKNSVNVTVHDIYEEYPDWKINVKQEQELLLSHQRIVFQFPLYWYSSPPLLKKWQDDVLEYGWAYGKGGTRLHGKQLLVATSIGGHIEVYRAGGRNHFTMSEILRPFQATANICGMSYLPCFVVNGVLNDKELTERAVEYSNYIQDQSPRGLAR